jgi:hypothetical protein
MDRALQNLQSRGEQEWYLPALVQALLINHAAAAPATGH